MTRLRFLLDKTLGQPPRCLFVEFSLRRRAWETFGCAAVSGVVTGFALGLNLWLYLATAGIASIGGIPAATQHRTRWGAVARTTVGGFVWAAAVLLVFLATGRQATTHLPDPIGWYLVIATLPATAVGWIVWTVARRLSPEALHRQPQPTRTGRRLRPAGPLPAQAAAALP